MAMPTRRWIALVVAFKKKLTRPAAPPMSACPRCHKNGVPVDRASKASLLYFTCACGTTWTCGRGDALKHGTFCEKLEAGWASEKREA